MSEGLDKPIQFLKGVGPRRAVLFEHLGVRTVFDLLHHYPRLWQDRHETSDLRRPAAPGLIVLRGRVLRAASRAAGPRLALYQATLATSHGKVECVWFKHLSRRFDVFRALKKEVREGADLWIVGHADPDLIGIREVRVDEHYPLEDERWRLHVARTVPVYALTEGLSQRFVRELSHAALKLAADETIDAVPPEFRTKRRLLAAPQALRGLHFPRSEAELEAARSRLAYEELLLLELAWILKRRQTRGLAKGFGYEIKRTLLSPFRQGLGFELTAAQKRVINEIFEDMRASHPMTRLLQGDVGSGKTVVALSALLLAVENGGQGALMAPTEILADQHRATLDRFLKGLPVRAISLTSRVSKKNREKLLAAVAAGEADLVVGTHALLEEGVRFKNLRLAIVDEQHRFGVRQRTTLRQKGSLIDLLVMTATPIPRTLALALYGDLEVSTIDEMPPGRTPIKTLIASPAQAMAAVRREVLQGRQAYLVYPIIEESARLDLQSAKAEFDRLSKEVFPDFKVALIHGAMPGRRKTEVMAEFSRGEKHILVATPVIEVGIDVPNATVMVIQNADRFGLASLHQLRGRIGRGAAESTCFLIADPRTPQARRRIDTMVETADGFRIGEEDLKLRGPGELLGMAQHGELTLQVADLFKDAELLAHARADADEVLSADAKLSRPEHALLRRRLLALYQSRWNWIDLA
ncbi:MAG TPA: DNA helicase RecG [Elusimicrobia bacterium]|nr:MAG: ATP-dependent DNA helicase RecG [Elusimicrobia bacterium GWA2_66_18]OGR75260.1 MAG: ATP-dependent DNA helicase RecG [Elusimicrobia bacterium GWC2_65_9]HAZ09376.1 DNA helicase RecG [Elusimicrobiota bacterium]